MWNTFYEFGLGSRHVTTWESSYPCFHIKQVLLAFGWSFGLLTFCHTPLLSMNLNNSLTKSETGALQLQWRLLTTRQVIWHQYYTLPVIICFFFFSFPHLAGSLWRFIIFSWEALVFQRPLTSLDAALSGRFPPWPPHKWQTLTKPQICAESSLWFMSSSLPVYSVFNVLWMENHQLLEDFDKQVFNLSLLVVVPHSCVWMGYDTAQPR